MKRRKFNQVMAFLAMLFYVAPVITPVWANSLSQDNKSGSLAQEANQGCSNLDVVFIVDQSWAMSAPGTQEATDPLKQRKFAVDAMIDLLTGLALDQCPGTHHRISVISYGSDVRTNLKMYSINPSTAQEANELRDENGIKKNIVADNLGSDNNPEAAFAEAARIWRNTPELDDEEVSRKRVIIFLTNGISKSSPEDYAKGTESVKNQVRNLFPFDRNLLNLEICLSKLRKQNPGDEVPPEEANNCMASSPVDKNAYENSTYIWTVFLKPPGYEKYGQAYENIIHHYDEMSREHGGEAIELKPNSRKDIPSTFRKILSYLAGVRPVLLNCGEFAVNPYLNEARLTVYKIDPEIKITLAYVDQNGIQHSIVEGNPSSPDAFEVKDYYSFGANEAYIFSYPHAGIWQLTADNCQGLDTYYEQVEVDTSREMSIPDLIPQYESTPFYDPEHPQYLVYEMHDKTGKLIPQASLPRLALNINATVASPSGDKKDYVLTWDATTNSFHSKEPLLVSSSGTYNVQMVGTTYTHEGNPSPLDTNNPEVIFNKPFTLLDIDTQFEVAPVTPFTIDVVNPLPDTQIKNVHALSFDRWVPLNVAPLIVSVRLLDRDKNMLTNPEEYLKFTHDVFTAYVEGEEQTSAEIKLQPDTNNPGYFTGKIPDFAVIGEQKVVVLMDESARLEDRRPYNREVKAEFKRVDDLVHTGGFWQFLLIFVIFLATEETIRYFAIRNNKVSGTLIFQDGTVTIVEFNLANGKNTRVITQRELKLYPQIMLRSITIKNSTNRHASKTDNDPGGVSYIGETQASVHVSCININKQSGLNTDIPADYPQIYDDTSLTMMYKPL